MKAEITGKELTLRGWNTATAPTVNEVALELKSKALDLALAVKTVTTPKEQELAVKAKRLLKDIRVAVEAQRKEIKAPVKNLGEEIDRTASEYMAELVEAEKRLDGLINHFQQLQLRAQREQEERAQQEILAKQREAEAAKAEAERQRKLAEELAAKGKAKQAEAAEDKALDAELAAEQAAMEAQSAQPAALAINQPKGLTARESFDYELAGRTPREQQDNLYAFAQAFPELCDIKIRRAAVLDRLNRGDGFRTAFPEDQPLPPDWTPKAPGLRVFKVMRSQVR